MTHNFFTFSGVLSPKQYTLSVLAVFLATLVAIGILGVILDIQDAEVPGAPALNQAIAVTAFFAQLTVLATAIVSLLSMIVRRARDTGNTVLWSMATIIPFPITFLMMIILGLVPSRPKVS